MPRSFYPRLDVLPAPQMRLWSELAATPPEFTLYGGTAIALHLGHRQSVDFDFFAARDLQLEALIPAIPFLAGAEVIQREPNTLSCLIDRGGPVKLSFFGVPRLRRLLRPLVAPDTGLKIASLLDLASLKATVVQLRAEAKDYLDIDALIQLGGIGLPSALAGASAIYGSAFNPQVTLKALCYFEEGDLPSLPAAVRQRLASAVRAVDLAALPQVAGEGDPA